MNDGIAVEIIHGGHEAILKLIAPLRPVPSTAHVRAGLLKVMAAVRVRTWGRR